MATDKCDCKFFIQGEKDWEPHYSTCNSILSKKKYDFHNQCPRNPDGSLAIQNPYLKDLKEDILYHLALGTKSHDLKKIFGDVKFVCMGGTAQRMEEIANMAIEELKIKIPDGCQLYDLTAKSQRFSLYKVGPLICVNHGIGMSSMSVVLQEIIKLLQYSGAKDPIIFRVGTSGGINIPPGTVVVTDKSYNGLLKETYDLAVLGKLVEYPAILDKRLAQELKSLSDKNDGFLTVLGGTVGAEDFYNGQGRTDGPLCNYSEEDKFAFLKTLSEKNIKNFEMEAPCFAHMTHKAGIKAADICIALINRFQGDQVTVTKEMIIEWQKRPIVIVIRYMKAYLKSVGKYPYGFGPEL